MGDLKCSKVGEKRSARRQLARYDVRVANERWVLKTFMNMDARWRWRGKCDGRVDSDGIAGDAEIAREESSAPEAK